MMIRAIDRRRHNNYAIEAGFHGIKVPMRFNRERIEKQDQVEANEADQKVMERLRREAEQRVRSRVRTHN